MEQITIADLSPATVRTLKDLTPVSRLLVRAALDQTAQRLAEPATWCSESYARDAHGEPVSINIGPALAEDIDHMHPNPEAVSYCVLGHLYCAARMLGHFSRRLADPIAQTARLLIADTVMYCWANEPELVTTPEGEKLASISAINDVLGREAALRIVNLARDLISAYLNAVDIEAIRA